MLRTVQFAYTIGTNDFVIGEPSNTDSESRYLVFQCSDQAGPSKNPHVSCFKDGNRWKLAFSEDGSTAVPFVTAGTNNNFTGSNTFYGDVVINKSLYLGPAVTFGISKNVMYLHAGVAGESEQAGIVIQESAVDVAWMRIHTDRNGWVLKNPANANTLTLRHAGPTVILDAPLAGGVIATEAYVTKAISDSIGASILDILKTRPRRSNYRIYYEKTLATNLKQPVMRVPSKSKVESISYFRNNSITITPGQINVTVRRGAGGAEVVIPVNIVPTDAPQAWVAVTLSTPIQLEVGDSITAVVINAGTGISDISVDISCILDF